tara:strand:- start:822 stop:1499 length:678 start_codon:yes stop_codon:yes gene_type:complete
VSVSRFIQRVSKDGGLASSNSFIVRILDSSVGSFDLDETIEFYCNEAQLPNINTAESSINGMYVGSGQVKYPHTRVYTEIQLGFLCDANMTVLKFLNKWQDLMFRQERGSIDKVQNREVRLSYMDEYVSDIAIIKAEPGPKSAVQRQPITYVLERAYPYAIDAVPLQYGTNQVVQVTAQFSYMRHYTMDHDIRFVKGDVSNMGETEDARDMAFGGGFSLGFDGRW